MSFNPFKTGGDPDAIVKMLESCEKGSSEEEEEN